MDCPKNERFASRAKICKINFEDNFLVDIYQHAGKVFIYSV